MKLVTASQMREIDKEAIEGTGISGLELMEKAGKSTAEVAKEMLINPKGKKVVIFCGRGNNGGDGFVIGRYLSKWGAKINVYLLSKISEVKGDAKVNLNKAKKLKLLIKEITRKEHLPKRIEADLIIDAIFGTGFEGEISGLVGDAVNLMNSSDIPVHSVDIPSGINATTGEVSKICIQAEKTVTMGLPKIGQFVFPGKKYCGEVRIADIGIPDSVVKNKKIDLNLITAKEIKNLLPKRKPDAYKGDCGRVVLIAGSTGMTGAACLAAESSLRAGAGMAILGIPESLNSIFEIKLTEVMTKPLPDVRKRGVLALRGLGEIKQLLKWGNCVALGPGLGQHFETVELVKRLIQQIELPTVIDADGLNSIAKDISVLKSCKAPFILTPHIGELSRLNKVPIEEIVKDRIKYAKEFAREYNCVLVFKGPPTIIAESKGQVYVNPTGNAGMATAGSGDVLTGIIVGFLAQGLSTLDSAICGVYIHGLAGDLACREKGQMGMIASDIMNKVPEAILRIN
jgi:ADP-dependent NAD(P)H-hydrate dehydratase / NAD(P)H-hydrate epimerase